MRILSLVVAVSLSGAALAQPAKPDAAFSYTYPAQARRIPALKSWFDREAVRLRAGVAADAAADHRDATKDGRPFSPYALDRTWKVVTETPRFLSLSMEAYDFTGGAHGNTAYDALVWDKTTGTRRAPLSFFTSKQALAAAIRPAFCRQLDAQRQEKRGGDGKNGFADFDKCIDPAAETVILGSSDHQHFDRIGILIAPYEAGPYSEGVYEVTLPVTAAVLAAVRPEWRRYFAVAGRQAGTP